MQPALLVTRVHKKARNLKDTHQFIYIGHEGHDEAIGTMGEAPMFLVETEDDVIEISEIKSIPIVL
jgi:4-hydroxy-3-methylbut-2-enyl diphosphate reductase